ncbi:MAG: AMP-binding protein [Deltaproteobacteria bacterium]|nr:AMP-binding protein [Deltaproteobacteria bacterium]
MEIIRRTIGQVVGEIAAKYPNNDALIHTEAGLHYNYGLLSWEVERTAKGLIRLGIREGDKVSLWAPNVPEWIIAQLALARTGAVLVPIDPGAGQEDLHYILDQSDAKAVIMTRGMEGEESLDGIMAVRDRLPSLEHIVLIGTESHPDAILWSELAAMGEEPDSDVLREREAAMHPEDPVAIMYTSGTTGVPKGVVLDHLGLINKSLASTRRQGLTPRDRLCLFFPLFHMFGNTCIALAGLLRGAALIMPCPTFDAEKILRAVFKEKCTAVYGSPSMIIALLDHPRFQRKRWQTVTKGTLGGAPCPMELMKRLVQDVGVTGVTVAYGITEASSWITMTHPDDPLELRTSTIGTPLECNEVKIVSPETGEDLPFHAQGELCVHGLLMKAYHKMPAATAAAIDRGGWFHTGDLGVMDKKGYVRITGRLKDVIVRGGMEIHPAEVEEVIYGLPEISEVQVFGFLHPKQGQEVAAWVKLKPGSELGEETLLRYLKRKMGKEKAPGHVKIVEGYPMTRSGKVQKFKLAEMALKEYT